MNRRRFNSLVSTAAASAGFGMSVLQARAQLVNKYAEDLNNGEYNWFPERSAAGPMLIIVSIPDQRVHVYRNGIRVAASSCSTGKPGHATPTGVFSILEKDKNHHSSTYNNAAMPNMNRLTWDGVALHAGKLPGYPASHGCVRLPLAFSELLFGITRKGMTVVMADEHSQPSSVTHPGMVLGDYARNEFDALDHATLNNSHIPADVAPPKITSVVVSRNDTSVTILEDGKVVSAGTVEITDAEKPLGEKVYTLTGSRSDEDSLQWSGVGYGKGDREDMANQIQRVKAEPAVRGEIRRRMHNGMTIVTTDGSHTEAHRVSDFTVIASD